MITPRDIENKTMSSEKRKSAKNDYFAFYIGRPLSYILTIPFLYIGISPDAVSLISIIPIIIGFAFMCIGNTKTCLLYTSKGLSAITAKWNRYGMCRYI